MPLTNLNIENTRVADLSPLRGLKLQSLMLTPQHITQGTEAVREMKSLTMIGRGVSWEPLDMFWKKYDAGDFGKPR